MPPLKFWIFNAHFLTFQAGSTYSSPLLRPLVTGPFSPLQAKFARYGPDYDAYTVLVECLKKGSEAALEEQAMSESDILWEKQIRTLPVLGKPTFKSVSQSIFESYINK